MCILQVNRNRWLLWLFFFTIYCVDGCVGGNVSLSVHPMRVPVKQRLTLQCIAQLLLALFLLILSLLPSSVYVSIQF